jgi:hypothetical protein
MSVLAAIFGGVGVQLLKKLTTRRSEEFEEAVRIRQELRQEIESLREELDQLKIEVEEWRTKYYQKVEETLETRSEIELMRAENAALHRRVNELFERNDNT